MDIDESDRMRMIDAVWLEIPQDDAPIAVGAVLEFQGRAPAIGRVQRRIADILPLAGRLQQIPVHSATGVRQPKWIDVEVDLAAHVHRRTVTDLAATVSDLLSSPMPFDRPLWEVWVLTGYAPREWALVWRLHHSVADGEGVTMVIGRTLDMEPQGGVTLTDWMQAQAVAARPPQSTEVEDSGSVADRALDTVRGVAEKLLGIAVATPPTVTSLLRMVPTPPTELVGVPSTGRDWRSLHLPLADVKAAGQAHGATINDVLMAAVTNGFRDVILAHGDDPGGRVVRAVMPVSMRRAGDTRSNNQVSMIPVELPVGQDGAPERLATVVRQTSVGKRSMAPTIIAAMNNAFGKLVPAPISEQVVSHGGWAVGWMTDTLVTNVRGPSSPEYFLGQQVRYLAPIIPIGARLRTVVGINSYAGSVNVSVTGDAAHAEDNRILLAGIAAGVAELRAG